MHAAKVLCRIIYQQGLYEVFCKSVCARPTQLISQKVFQRMPKTIQKPPPKASLERPGTPWEHSGGSWALSGATWGAQVGPRGGNMGQLWANLVPTWGQKRVHMSPRGTSERPSRGPGGLPRAIFGKRNRKIEFCCKPTFSGRKTMLLEGPGSLWGAFWGHFLANLSEQMALRGWPKGG